MLTAKPKCDLMVCPDGYALEPTGEKPGGMWQQVIVPVSDRLKPPVDADRVPALYRRFADLAFEPEAYVGFAKDYGALGGRHAAQTPLIPHPPELIEWVALHRATRLLLGMPIKEAPELQPVIQEGNSPFNIKSPFEFDPQNVPTYREPSAYLHRLMIMALIPLVLDDPKTGLPELVVTASNLEAFIALQVFEELKVRGTSQASEIRYCRECEQPFAVGGEAGRRRSADFCSISCGSRHRYQLKKKKQQTQR